ADYIKGLSWPDLVERSGVEEATIREIANLYSAADNAVFSWGMGITHHRQGVENVEAISNLAMLRGMVGAPGRGRPPLLGHSNVQGVGSMGVTPALKDQVFTRLRSELGVDLPTARGMDTLECMEAAARGEIDVAFLLGGNLYAANPDLTFADQALARVP